MRVDNFTTADLINMVGNIPNITSPNSRNGRLVEKTKTFTAEVEDSQTELNGLKQSTMGNSNPLAGVRIR